MRFHGMSRHISTVLESVVLLSKMRWLGFWSSCWASHYISILLWLSVGVKFWWLTSYQHPSHRSRQPSSCCWIEKRRLHRWVQPSVRCPSSLDWRNDHRLAGRAIQGILLTVSEQVVGVSNKLVGTCRVQVRVEQVWWWCRGGKSSMEWKLRYWEKLSLVSGRLDQDILASRSWSEM